MTASSLFRFLVGGILSLMVAAAIPLHAQPALQFHRAINNWPTIELYISLTCDGWIQRPSNASLFTVRENGTPITAFTLWCPESWRTPSSTALVFDCSQSMGGDPILKAMQAGEAWVNHMDGTTDEACVLRFEGYSAVLQTMTTSRTLLRNTIAALPVQGTKAVWDGCHDGIMELASTGTNQARALILFSDGADEESTHTVGEVINLALAKRIAVHVFGYGNPAGEAALIQLAQGTHGRYFREPTQETVVRLFDEIASKPSIDECLIMYDAQCMDGSVRTVELTYSDCGGSDTRTHSYTAPATYPVRLETVSVTGGNEVTVPILIGSHDDSVDIAPLETVIEIRDPACGLTFLRAETPAGSGLEGITIATSVSGNDITLQTARGRRVPGSCMLAQLRFATTPRTDTCRTPLDFRSWIYPGVCDRPLLLGGTATVFPGTTAVEATPSDLTVQTHPNPVSSFCHVTVTAGRSAPVEILLTDVLGRPWLTHRIDAGPDPSSVDLDMRTFPPGVYFLICSHHGRIFQQSIIR